MLLLSCYKNWRKRGVIYLTDEETFQEGKISRRWSLNNTDWKFYSGKNAERTLREGITKKEITN